MSSHARFTLDEARAAGERLGIAWDGSPFSLEQFRMGMDVELEHGTRDPETNVTDDDVIMTAKIARAHLNEFPDYYTRLAKMKPRRRRTGPSQRSERTPFEARAAWPSRPASNAAAIAASGSRALSPMRVERIGGMRQTSWLDGLRIARVFGVRLGEVSQYRGCPEVRT